MEIIILSVDKKSDFLKSVKRGPEYKEVPLLESNIGV